MSTYDDLYCSLYIDCALDRAALLSQLAELVEGSVTLRTVKASLFELTVVSNDTFDSKKAQAPDGFVHYPFIVEVEPQDNVVEAEYILSLRSLLTALRERGTSVVPACDFENELTEKAAPLAPQVAVAELQKIVESLKSEPTVWSEKWTLGREISVGGFQPGTFADKAIVTF